MNRIALLTLLAAFLAAPAAFAQELIQTTPEGAGAPVASPAPAPVGPPLADPQSPEAIGAWARGVLAGAPAEASEPRTGPLSRSACAAATDDRPHGQVWAGAGTRGYRELGGVVTQPIGRCGSVTVAIDRSEGGGFGRRR